MQREVVIAGRMSADGRRAVVAVASQPARRKLEMPQRCAWLEPDLSADGGDAHRKIGFESIRGAGEVFVESPDLQGAFALHREISGHHVRHELANGAVEREMQIVARFRLRGLLSRLQNLAGDGPDLILRVRGDMN